VPNGTRAVAAAAAAEIEEMLPDEVSSAAVHQQIPAHKED